MQTINESPLYAASPEKKAAALQEAKAEVERLLADNEARLQQNLQLLDEEYEQPVRTAQPGVTDPPWLVKWALDNKVDMATARRLMEAASGRAR